MRKMTKFLIFIASLIVLDVSALGLGNIQIDSILGNFVPCVDSPKPLWLEAYHVLDYSPL